LKPTALYYSILKYQSENRNFLDKHFNVQELPNPSFDNDEILAKIEVLFAPLGYKIDNIKITKCQNLKVIISNTTGIPHIDISAASLRGITICALHDEQIFLQKITPTAEHTIGLMLAALRRIPAAHFATCSGSWDRRPWGASRMLSRMTLGIVGMGRLGSKVARIADAMEMKVRWFDPYVIGGESSLLNLARESDILSLHAVANSETLGLISRNVLEALPKGALVINTARGELIDSSALIDLLEAGHLSAAALDTIEGEYEPNFTQSFISSRIATYARNHDNLILTPHIGGSTIDAWYETERRVIIKACRALNLSIENYV